MILDTRPDMPRHAETGASTFCEAERREVDGFASDEKRFVRNGQTKTILPD